jgi:hypothetical protein
MHALPSPVRPVVAIVLLVLSIVPGRQAAARAASTAAVSPGAARKVFQFNPRLSGRAVPHVAPAMKVVEQYLDRVDGELPPPLRGTVRHTISGAYGSGFLRHNVVGNDLDYFANVHLGTVKTSADDHRAAAREILGRIDAYRHRAQALAQANRQPALAVYRFMDAAPPGPLADDAETVAHLAASLRHVVANRPYLVAVAYRGVSEVTALPAGQAYLPLVTNAQFFSNIVDQGAGVFWGIRGLSLELFFTVDLEVAGPQGARLLRSVPLSPLAPARLVGQLWQQAYSGVFASEAAATTFQSQILPTALPVPWRLEYAQGFLGAMAFEREVRHYPVKFLKRMHLLVDALYPIIPPARRDPLETLLATELKSDAALYADQVKTLSETLRSLSGDRTLLSLFVRSGDVGRVLAFLTSAARRLGASSNVEVRQEAGTVLARLHDLEARPGWRQGEGLDVLQAAGHAMAAAGLRMEQRLSVSPGRMEELWTDAERLFLDLGYRPVRLHALDNGVVGFDPASMACGKDPRGLVAALDRDFIPLEGETFRPAAAPEAAPPTEAGMQEPPPRRRLPRPFTYYLRCAGDQAADVAYRAAVDSLEGERASFVATPSGAPSARQSAVR